MEEKGRESIREKERAQNEICYSTRRRGQFIFGLVNTLTLPRAEKGKTRDDKLLFASRSLSRFALTAVPPSGLRSAPGK